MKKIILILPLIFLLCFNAKAIEEKDILDFSGEGSLYELLPDGISKESAESLINEGNTEIIEKEINESFLKKIKDAFGNNLKFFAGITGILIISSIMSSINSSFENPSFKKGFDYLYLACLSMYILNYIDASTDIAVISIDAVNKFILSCLPFMTYIWGLGGNAVLAAKNGAFIMFSIEIIDTLMAKFLVPLIKVSFIFSVASAVNESILSKVSNFIKKSVKIICVLLFTSLSAILFFKSSIAGMKDSIAMRGVRFAAGNFIPIVGNLVGETSRTLFSLLGLIRAKCGVFIILIIIFIAVFPLISLFIKKIFLLIAGGLASILGQSSGEKLIGDITSVYDVLIAALCSSSVYFIIFAALFVKTVVI